MKIHPNDQTKRKTEYSFIRKKLAAHIIYINKFFTRHSAWWEDSFLKISFMQHIQIVENSCNPEQTFNFLFDLIIIILKHRAKKDSAWVKINIISLFANFISSFRLR